MDANIENLTDINLTIDLVSDDSNLSRSLDLAPIKIVLFQEVFDIGNTYLEPSLSDYDSKVIKNNVHDVLKVYKPENIGKNLYYVKNWIAKKPSKRLFTHDF